MNRLIVLCLGLAVLFGGNVPAQDKQDKEVATLIKGLKDKDETVRLKAVKQLGRLGARAKEALPTLMELLKDEDDNVKTYAKLAIDAIKTGKELKETKDTKDTKDGKGGIDDLIKDLKSRNLKARDKALDELIKLGEEGKPAATAVVELILDTPAKSREKLYDALEKIDVNTSKMVMPLVAERNLQKWAEAFDVIDAAGEEAKPCIPVIRRCYQTDLTGKLTKDYSVAQRSLVTLVKIDPEDKVVIQTVLGALATTNRGPTIVRAKALDVIKDLKAEPKDVVKAMISAMNDKVCTLVVIEALGELGKDAKDAIPILTKLKGIPDKQLAEAAGKALEAINAAVDKDKDN